MPTIPFIGVLISWLMLAKKSPFALAAASALICAVRNSFSAATFNFEK